MRNPTFAPRKATFRASRLSGRDVRASLSAFGCALIKGLFDLAKLREIDQRIEANSIGVEEALMSAGAPNGWNVGYPLYFGGLDATSKVHNRLKATYPQIFEHSTMQGMDCETVPSFVFDALAKTGLGKIIRKHLGLERLRTSPAICHIRKFDFPVGMDLYEAERGLEFHQDNRLYNVGPDMLTLWFPFRYEHGAMASLEFLPMGERRLLPTITQCGIDRDSVPQEMFWSPAYELGDAVLLSGYCPHRTYYPRTGSKARTSIDFRFFSTEVPAPIYAPLTKLQRWLGSHG